MSVVNSRRLMAAPASPALALADVDNTIEPRPASHHLADDTGNHAPQTYTE
jgi:hypothetical protein